MRTLIELTNMIRQGNNVFNANDILGLENRIERTRELLERNGEVIWEGEVKFMLWNATGMMPNLDRIVKRMEDEEILFCFVTETWLNPKHAIPAVCKESSSVCTIMPQGRDRGKNGVSMIVNPKMSKHKALKDTEVMTKDTINGTFLHVKIGSVNILCIYYPPSCETELEIWLEEVLLKCNIDSGRDLIILGDFNARLKEWNDHENNSRGISLRELMENIGLTRIDSGPNATFIKSMSRPQDGWSIVDHVFSNCNQIECSVVPPFNSSAGHRPIKGKFMISADTRNEPPKYKRLLLENIRKEDVKNSLTRNIENLAARNIRKVRDTRNEILTSTSIDHKQKKIDLLDKELTENWLYVGRQILGEKVAGKRVIKHDYLHSSLLEALESEIIWESDEVRLRQLMKSSEKERTRLRKEKFDLFADKIGNAPATDMMKVVSSMLRNRRKEQQALNSSPASLEAYKCYFEGMNKNSLPIPSTTTEPIMHPMRDPDPSNIERHFGPSIIKDIIKRTQWNKAPGASGLTYDLLKCGDHQTTKLISEFFKLLVHVKLVPQAWKRSIVVPVPKKGDLTQIKNYRPISLTEPLRKIFEHCMLRYVNDSTGPSFLTQGGFRTNHCCNDMIVVLQETMLTMKKERRKQKTENKNMHVAFLDIKAAYDSVDRRILWRRCINRGLCPDAVDILKQLFDHNSSQVVVNGRKSSPYHIDSGVLQGSVLSPCLYSLFIDDLARELETSYKVKIGSAEINCTMYADDIALFADEAWKLQELLNICTMHAEKNRYIFNSSKCESISDEGNEFFIHGKVMPSTKVFKYLGVEMKRDGIDYKAFLKRRIDESKRAAEKLIGMGMNLGGLPLKAASILYKVFIRPKLEASMCILPTFKNVHVKLDSAQCVILRRILRTGKSAISTICRSLLQTPRMYHRIKWLRSRFIRRFDHILESTHILKTSSTSESSWIERELRFDLYGEDVDKNEAWSDEMNYVHSETQASTGDTLQIKTSKRLPWFIITKVPSQVLRPILNWILKRYPGMDPPICSKCRSARATHDHIALCSKILENEFPETCFRFRPEKSLSTVPETNRAEILENLARTIAKAVSNSIPQFNFEILSDN